MIPSEISAAIRAAATTVQAHRRLRQAVADEASPAARARLEKAVIAALDAQDRALAKVAAVAKRPNAPLDLEKMLAGALRVLGAVQSGTRELRGAAKKIIDVEVIDS